MWKDKEKRRQYHRKWHADRMTKLRKLCGNVCEFCGYAVFPEILEFSHRHDKERTIQRRRLTGVSWDRLVHEVTHNCRLLCPNCHTLYDMKIG